MAYTCGSCRGAGKFKCPTCRGKGCEYCDYKGHYDCPTCDGVGEIEVYDDPYSDEDDPKELDFSHDE